MGDRPANSESGGDLYFSRAMSYWRALELEEVQGEETRLPSHMYHGTWRYAIQAPKTQRSIDSGNAQQVSKNIVIYQRPRDRERRSND